MFLVYTFTQNGTIYIIYIQIYILYTYTYTYPCTYTYIYNTHTLTRTHTSTCTRTCTRNRTCTRTCTHILIHIHTHILIYTAISNGKRKPRHFSLIPLPFAHSTKGSLLFKYVCLLRNKRKLFVRKQFKRNRQTKWTCPSVSGPYQTSVSISMPGIHVHVCVHVFALSMSHVLSISMSMSETGLLKYVPKHEPKETSQPNFRRVHCVKRVRR
jgi:hypothetical protein